MRTIVYGTEVSVSVGSGRDRQVASIKRNVEFDDFGGNGGALREHAVKLAVEYARSIGFGALLDNPDARISITAHLGEAVF